MGEGHSRTQCLLLLLGQNPIAIILILFKADINKSIQNNNENVPSYRSSPHHGVPLKKGRALVMMVLEAVVVIKNN